MSLISSLNTFAGRVPPLFRAMAWLTLSGLLFVTFTGIIRWIGGGLPPVEAAFLRYAFGLLILIPLFWRNGLGALRTTRLRLHGVRGVIHGLGVLLWFYAMTRIPIADVTALGFSSPIYVTIGAVLFLGERIRLRRVLAVLLGFLGVLIILRPGVEAIDMGAIAMVVAAPMFAISKIATKILAEKDSGLTIVAYLSIFATLTMLPPALWYWQPPSAGDLFWLAVTALIATISHLAMIRAVRLAELTVLQPVEYLNLVWATLMGLYIFAEEPSIWIWLGGGVIVGSASYIAHREARLRNSPAPPSAQPPS